MPEAASSGVRTQWYCVNSDTYLDARALSPEPFRLGEQRGEIVYHRCHDEHHGAVYTRDAAAPASIRIVITSVDDPWTCCERRRAAQERSAQRRSLKIE